MDFSLTDARELLANEALWPAVRTYLAKGGAFKRFERGPHARLALVDADTRRCIDLWIKALQHAHEWQAVIDAPTVRSLKETYPGIYPEVFRYTLYFSKYQPIDPNDEAMLMLLLKLKFPEVYALCSS